MDVTYTIGSKGL